jgi:hypothetical protein
MATANEVDHSPASEAWRRADAVLSRLQNKLDALEAKSEFIGPEVLAALRQDHAQLRRELGTLRDAFQQTPSGSATEALRARADDLVARTTQGARNAYERLRTTVTDTQTKQALKDGFGDLGRGIARAGRDLGGAAATAVGRFRRGTKDPASSAPTNGPSGRSSSTPTRNP